MRFGSFDCTFLPDVEKGEQRAKAIHFREIAQCDPRHFSTSTVKFYATVLNTSTAPLPIIVPFRVKASQQ